MASVRKLDPKDPTSPWIVEYTDQEGKRRRKTPKTGLKKDAEAIRKQIEREISDQLHTADRGSMPFGRLCELFMLTTNDRLKDGRIGRSRHGILKLTVEKTLLPILGPKVLIKDIKPIDLERAYRQMIGPSGLKPRTAKERIMIYRQIEDFAINRNFLKQGVAAVSLKELRGIATTQVRTFSREQVAALLEALDSRRFKTTDRIHRMVRCMVHLALFCGLRKGEILGLTFENVDFDRKVIKVRHSLTEWDDLKGPKTRSGLRDVPLHPHTAAELKLWLTKGYIDNKRGLLFRGRAGAFIRQSQFHNIYWHPLLRQAGLADENGDNLHFHALRHFYASFLIASGVSVTDTADLLGHKHFDMTLQTYAHPMMGARQRQENIEMAIGGLIQPRAYPQIDAT